MLKNQHCQFHRGYSQTQVSIALMTNLAPEKSLRDMSGLGINVLVLAHSGTGTDGRFDRREQRKVG